MPICPLEFDISYVSVKTFGDGGTDEGRANRNNSSIIKTLKFILLETCIIVEKFMEILP